MVGDRVSEEVARMVHGLLREGGQETEATGVRRERHRYRDEVFLANVVPATMARANVVVCPQAA